MRIAGPVAEPTFAEEMLATALVELRQNRIRSAILHAVIGYESAVKRGLDTLLKARLKGLESAAVLEAVSREMSVGTLGRVVLSHVEAVTDPPLDWDKINALYRTRNMIVHRGQRRMPPYESVRDQVLEVRTYVRRLQEALQSSEPH